MAISFNAEPGANAIADELVAEPDEFLKVLAAIDEGMTDKIEKVLRRALLRAGDDTQARVRTFSEMLALMCREEGSEAPGPPDEEAGRP